MTTVKELARQVGIALLVTLLGAVIRKYLLGALGTRIVWVTFYPMVVLASLYGGLASGLLTAILSCLVAIFGWSFFIAQPFIKDGGDWLGLGDMMRERAEAKGLRLQVELASDLPRFVHADEKKLRRMTLNLLGNAIKFTPQGEVVLRCERGVLDEKAQPHLLLQVRDTGPGIAAEDQQRIFEPFVQLGEDTGRKGTGLGLAIVRQHAGLLV